MYHKGKKKGNWWTIGRPVHTSQSQWGTIVLTKWIREEWLRNGWIDEVFAERNQSQVDEFVTREFGNAFQAFSPLISDCSLSSLVPPQF